MDKIPANYDYFIRLFISKFRDAQIFKKKKANGNRSNTNNNFKDIPTHCFPGNKITSKCYTTTDDDLVPPDFLEKNISKTSA